MILVNLQLEIHLMMLLGSQTDSVSSGNSSQEIKTRRTNDRGAD